MSKQEATRLADALEHEFTQGRISNQSGREAADKLRQWPDGEPVAWREHVEQRLHSWQQSQMGPSGDRLALEDFMCDADIDDLIDWVCSEYAGV